MDLAQARLLSPAVTPASTLLLLALGLCSTPVHAATATATADASSATLRQVPGRSAAVPASDLASPISTVRYDGHLVVTAFPRSIDDLQFIEALADDVWTEHTTFSTTFRLAPDKLAALYVRGIPLTVMHTDAQLMVDLEAERIAEFRATTTRAERLQGPITEYLSPAEHSAYVDRIASDTPELCSIDEVGRSFENRPIRTLTVNRDESGTRPVFMFLSGNHAREWLAHHATLCAVERLIDDYASDDELGRRLRGVELVMITMGNPDGYDYTWTDQRYWRKNRNGPGVDLNRNWDAAWATASSDSPFSEIYHGTAPFSEPETQAYRDVITPLADRIAGFVDVHAYGSLILLPYGYTAAQVENDAEYRSVGNLMAEGTDDAYRPIRITDFVGSLTSGSSVDWVHDNTDDALSFGIEVRGNDFVVDASQIAPTCDEVYGAFVALIETRSPALF